MRSIFQRPVLLGSAVAVVHFILAMACFAFSFGDTMRRFDEGVAERTPLLALVDKLGKILMEPGMMIWRTLPASRLPNVIEWLLVLANSALWGFAIAFVVVRIVTRRSIRQHGLRDFGL